MDSKEKPTEITAVGIIRLPAIRIEATMEVNVEKMAIAEIVRITKSTFKDKTDSFIQQIKQQDEFNREFLSPDSKMKQNKSLLMTLRKWNSFTPAIPKKGAGKSIGGGYFLLHNGKGTVIDPGYDFINNLADADGAIVDIHNIVITHAHNDHTNDLESLMTLLHQYNKEREKDSSVFRVEEFTPQFPLKELIDALNSDGLTVDETIEALNKLLQRPDLYDKLVSKFSGKTPSPDLTKQVKAYKCDPNMSALKKLNRLALEEFYPQKTPKSQGKKPKKKIQLFMNLGSFMKFSGLINLRDKSYIERVVPLTAGQSHVLDGDITLTVLPAYHDEVVSTDYSVGLHFSVKTSKGERRIIFTSDTGYFRQKLVDNELVADVDSKPITSQYPAALLKDIDVLIPHLGSLKKEELTEDYNTNPEKVFYANHLGLHGTVLAIYDINPELAVISEFGEELRNIRKDFMRLVCKAVVVTSPETTVLPADLSFICDLADMTIRDDEDTDKGFVPYDKVGTTFDTETSTFKYTEKSDA